MLDVGQEPTPEEKKTATERSALNHMAILQLILLHVSINFANELYM